MAAGTNSMPTGSQGRWGPVANDAHNVSPGETARGPIGSGSSKVSAKGSGHSLRKPGPTKNTVQISQAASRRLGNLRSSASKKPANFGKGQGIKPGVPLDFKASKGAISTPNPPGWPGAH